MSEKKRITIPVNQSTVDRIRKNIPGVVSRVVDGILYVGLILIGVPLFSVSAYALFVIRLETYTQMGFLSVMGLILGFLGVIIQICELAGWLCENYEFAFAKG